MAIYSIQIWFVILKKIRFCSESRVYCFHALALHGCQHWGGKKTKISCVQSSRCGHWLTGRFRHQRITAFEAVASICITETTYDSLNLFPSIFGLCWLLLCNKHVGSDKCNPNLKPIHWNVHRRHRIFAFSSHIENLYLSSLQWCFFFIFQRVYLQRISKGYKGYPQILEHTIKKYLPYDAQHKADIIYMGNMLAWHRDFCHAVGSYIHI